jgi:hypothetical protein
MSTTYCLYCQQPTDGQYYKGPCPKCQPMTLQEMANKRVDDGRTYHDVAHARAVREARAAVVDAAKAWKAAFSENSKVPYTIARAHAVTQAEDALIVAVRALDAVERGEP